MYMQSYVDIYIYTDTTVLLDFTDTVFFKLCFFFFFFFLQTEGLWQLCLASLLVLFFQDYLLTLCLCHILVILRIF